MTELAEAPVVHAGIDFLDPATFESGPPFEALAMLRSRSPIVRAEDGTGAGYWVVLGHAELAEISRTTELFSSWEMSCFPKDPRPSDLPEIRQMLLNMDPPDHTAYRRIVSRVFTPRMVRELSDAIAAHARDVVAALPDGEPFDFVAHVAVEMSLRVLADVLGIPQRDRHLLFDWTERLVGDGDTELGGDPRAFASALMEMFAYADAQTEAKRAQATDDVWSMVANAEVDGERLGKEELNRFFQLLATAGNETTRTLISGGYLALLDHRSALHRLRADPARGVDAAVEEMLRFHSPILQFRRTATVDTRLAGTQIGAGDKVLLSYAAANRDPRAFADPDAFVVDRAPNPHVAFGIGPHFCLGAHLARVQARALFVELLRQPFVLEAAGEPVRVRSTLVNGYRSVPVEKTRA